MMPHFQRCGWDPWLQSIYSWLQTVQFTHVGKWDIVENLKHREDSPRQSLIKSDLSGLWVFLENLYQSTFTHSFGIKRLFTKGKERLFTAIGNRGSNIKVYEGYYLSHINLPGLFGSSHSNGFHLLPLQAVFQIKVCMIALKGCILLIKSFCSRPCVCLSLQGIQH